MPLIPYPPILLTLTTTVFVIILNQGRVKGVEATLLMPITTAFATTVPTWGRSQGIIIETGRATNTEMARDKVADVEIVADVNPISGNKAQLKHGKGHL
jgi:hypothetical protein